MPEVGVRLPVTETICSSKQDCESKNPAMELGVVYEVEAVLDRELSGDDFKKVYEVIKQVRSRYPGVSINYIGIQGNRVIVQMFDEQPAGAWQVIAILVLILAILIAAQPLYHIVELFIRALKELAEKLPEVLPQLPWWVGFSVAAAAVGVSAASVGYLVRSFRKKAG